ncbi:DUF3153 domain-containing protein [Halobacillus halophilus]|uniref:LPXTG cell wall anchor domain-containing protein n=1 Tax=Halobacillus halophilus TaxID=1570 RepID=UPI001368FEE8|nr:LPXTG cell wall anchor domain-containing protein [Halobacillus halophilus]MYL29639.1 DUF3153 domain-containing protein [Halobacillus halophilus]
MRKRLGMLLLVSLLFISGCVQGDVKLTVNKDKSGDARVQIGVNEEEAGLFMDRMQGVIDEAEQDLESRGYQVEPYEEDGYVGFTAGKAFDNVEEIQVPDQLEQPAAAGIGDVMEGLPVEWSEEPGWFTTTYQVEAEMDLKNSGIMGGMQQMVSDQLDLTFTLDLPIAPEDHNADRVDGNELQWDIQTAGTTNMMVEIAVPNIRNIIITAVAALLIIGAVLFYMRKKRKTKQN